MLRWPTGWIAVLWAEGANGGARFCGTLASGAPIALHYRGGLPRDGRGFLWEINGTGGDIRITAPMGHLQLAPLTIEVAQGEAKAFSRPQLPPEVFEDLPGDPVPYNVARIYARMAADLRDGTRAAPTFDDAVRLHRLIAAIEEGASTGRYVRL